MSTHWCQQRQLHPLNACSPIIFKRTLAEVAGCGRGGLGENNNGEKNSEPFGPSAWKHNLNCLPDALCSRMSGDPQVADHTTTNIQPQANTHEMTKNNFITGHNPRVRTVFYGGAGSG